MPTTHRLAAMTFAATVAVLLGGCGERPTGSPAPKPSDLPAAAAAAYQWGDEPPPVVLEVPGRPDSPLTIWTSCWVGPPHADGTGTGRCADGGPDLVGRLPRVDEMPVRFSFAMPGWTFEGGLVRREDGKPCRAKVFVHREDDRHFTLRTTAPPGDYRVDLFGRGEQGDVAASFRYRVVTPDRDTTAC